MSRFFRLIKTILLVTGQCWKKTKQKNKKKQINLKNMLLKKTELKLKPCEAFEKKKLAEKEFRTSQ